MRNTLGSIPSLYTLFTNFMKIIMLSKGYSNVSISTAMTAVENYEREIKRIIDKLNNVEKTFKNNFSIEGFFKRYTNDYIRLMKRFNHERSFYACLNIIHPELFSDYETDLYENHHYYVNNNASQCNSIKNLCMSSKDDYILCNDVLCQFINRFTNNV